MARKTKNPGTNRQSMSGTGNSNSAGIAGRVGKTIYKHTLALDPAQAKAGEKARQRGLKQRAALVDKAMSAMESVTKHMKKLY